MTFNLLLSIAFLCSSVTLLASQKGAEPTRDLALGMVQFETVVVADGGGGHHRSGVVVQTTERKNKTQSFGISNEAGVVVMPLPQGEYCYDAFSRSGQHLELERPASERCFSVKKGQNVEVGVGFRQ